MALACPVIFISSTVVVSLSLPIPFFLLFFEFRSRPSWRKATTEALLSSRVVDRLFRGRLSVLPTSSSFSSPCSSAPLLRWGLLS